MCWLIAGLVIFFGVHLFSSFRAAREKLIQRLGENRYKAGYALLAIGGFILIVIGVGKTEPVPLWEPVEWGRYAAVWFMPFAFILLSAAFIPSNFQRFTAHPMMWSVTLWALLHLLANGNLTEPASCSVPSGCMRFMRCPRRTPVARGRRNPSVRFSTTPQW